MVLRLSILHIVSGGQSDVTIDTTLTAKLRASVRTLGAALGACLADPHTDKCRSLWLCEQHRVHLAPPAAECGAGEAI